jgi:hypothetical protein
LACFRKTALIRNVSDARMKKPAAARKTNTTSVVCAQCQVRAPKYAAAIEAIKSSKRTIRTYTDVSLWQGTAGAQSQAGNPTWSRPPVELEGLGWMVYFDDKWGSAAGQANWRRPSGHNSLFFKGLPL